MTGWTITRILLAGLLPLALGATEGRWGHTSVYVPALESVYVIGGQVQSSGSKVTNDVLIMNLGSKGATFSAGPNDGLPAHAFAAASLSQDGGNIAVLGGIAASCASDATTHTFSLSDQTWQSVSPSSFVRRRGSAAAWVDDGTAGGEIVVVGGVADTYSCSSSSFAYPATDVFQFPLSTTAPTTKGLPSQLTGSNLAISDYAFTRGPDGSLYMMGGQDVNGNAVPLTTIGRWASGRGWFAETTTGSVPSGRVGASLVAHPTLDLLILHGGSEQNTPSPLVAFLNTTTWAWSTPQNLQPPSSSAIAYHTSVMTSQGVMITAFGLTTNGSPSSQVYFLDMRDPSQQAWTWKSVWATDMLQPYTSTAESTNTAAGTTVANNNTSGKSESEQESVSGDKKKVTSIVVPVIIVALIILPLSIWFLRRKLRMEKKRRMARHFSFSSQEDEGDFRRSVSSLRSPSRKTKTRYGFGWDANEKDGNLFTDLTGAVKRWTNSRRSISSEGNPAEREMMQVDRQRVSRLDERTMRWEEIDFGLGKLDERAQGRSEARRASMPALSSPRAESNPFVDSDPLIQLHDDSTTWSQDGLHHHEHPMQPVPELLIQPPTVQTSPAATLPDPAFNPSAQDGLDWNILAQEMEARPAFRSISPTSVLRSHSHPAPPPPISTNIPVSPFEDVPTSLPYTYEDGYTPAPALVQSPVSVTPVQDVQSSGPPRLPPLDFSRPAADLPVQFPSPVVAESNTARRASQPIQGRQLAGGSARRGSMTHSPGAHSPISPDTTARRASNPISPASAAKYTTPWSPGNESVRGRGSPKITDRRSSGMSKLRVVNVADDEDLQA